MVWLLLNEDNNRGWVGLADYGTQCVLIYCHRQYDR